MGQTTGTGMYPTGAKSVATYESLLTVRSLFSHGLPLACLQLVQHLRRRNLTVTEVL